MTAKDFLKQYHDANLETDAKIEQIRRLHERATQTTQVIMPDRVQSNGEQDKLSKITSEVVDLERELYDSLEHLGRVRRQVSDAIEKVKSPTYRTLLELRYINENTWEEIAVKMHYHYRWVLELHGRALQEVEKLKTQH